MPRFLSKRLALGAALCSTALLLPLVSMADPTPPAPPATTAVPAPANPSVDQDEARRVADRHAYVAARLAALQAGLQLTPDQSSLWPPVESALQDLAKLRSRRHADHDQDGTPLEALKRRGEHLIAKGEAMQKLADAAGPLLARLTDDQKRRLPILIEGLRSRRILGRAFAIDEGGYGPRERHADDFSDREGYRGDRMFGTHEHREDADGHDGDRGWDHADRGHSDGFDHEDGWFGGHRHEHHHFEDDEGDHG